MTTYTGHILIAAESGQYVEPATFFPNGLAVHRGIFTDGGYSLTHVRSGLALRHRLTRTVAYKAARALASEDWTFDKDAVTSAHAERVRAVCGR